MDDFSPRLVSVASCDLATASAPRLSPALLFSLQFYVDRVALEPATVSTAPVDALLLGFQLLQYEIVVFDTPLSSTEPLVTTLRHGKSCLFEADAGELRDELQRHEDAPLTLLLLAQEHGRARLRAFAAVPLSLHVGLLDEDHSSRVHRICEWAGRSGSWELRDHRNNIVGSATGAVTLSCLGRALAPHLAQVLGVQVSKSQSRPSSPRSELIEVEKEQEERPTKTADCRIEDDIQGWWRSPRRWINWTRASNATRTCSKMRLCQKLACWTDRWPRRRRRTRESRDACSTTRTARSRRVQLAHDALLGETRRKTSMLLLLPPKAPCCSRESSRRPFSSRKHVEARPLSLLQRKCEMYDDDQVTAQMQARGRDRRFERLAIFGFRAPQTRRRGLQST